ncbi:MAG TPA: efflux RND transporter permease subunit, partial [Hellea balneolensis]|nr:efflux RND transporter permease subunit [Hellea balneolensis]
MRGLIAWWAKNTVAANLLMVAIVVMGIVGFNKLEREFFPSSTFNGMTVSVTWLGASPRDVEEQLVTRIEDAVTGIDGIDYLESSARESVGSVNIRTKVRADYDKIFDEVKVRIDGINNFPPDAFRPIVTRWDARADYMYMALHGKIDRLTLQRMANDIRDELAKLPGGELIQDISKLDEEVTIEISEDALRRYGLTFSQVAAAISGQSVNLSAGRVKTSVGDLQMKARNLANSAEDFNNIIIRQSADGGKVYLRDIAHIIDGFEDLDFVATYEGEEAIFFRALTPEVSNVSVAGKAFRDYIKKLNKELPPGIEMSMWFDGSTIFDARMGLIGRNAATGMLLVLVILILFLRPKVAFWVTIGILVSFTGAIA